MKKYADLKMFVTGLALIGAAVGMIESGGMAMAMLGLFTGLGGLACMLATAMD